MRPLLQELTHTHTLTIGKDAYHEFVLPPIQNPGQICTILADLTKNGGLPNPIYQPHSLHITLGALTEVEDLGIFIIALEILSGVTPARIKT
jgi:2'-5' RNA ligase